MKNIGLPDGSIRPAKVGTVKLFMQYISMHVRSIMQYKLSFFLSVFGQIVMAMSEFFGIWFLLSRFHAVQGFTFSEIVLCYSVTLLSFAIPECVFRGFDTFARVIGNGEFDRMMARPRSVMLQVLAGKMDIGRIGRLLQAGVMLVVGIAVSGVQWSLQKAAVLTLMILCGCALFAALFVVYASLCFFTLEGLEVMNIFTDGSREFGAYPMGIYGRTALKFYTFFIPLACVQYYPLLWILGRDVPWFYALTPLAALLFLVPAGLLWKIGMRRFRSTGS